MASSVHDKNGIDAEEMPPLEDVPDYDDLIESALDALDVYQARRGDMNLHLKKAFFNLAQAKLALGPARVGPASYHLGRIEPLLTVDITPTTDGLYAYTLVEAKPARKLETQSAKGKEKANGAIVDLRYDASTSAVKLDDLNEKSEGDKIRRRIQKILKQDKQESPSSTQAYSSDTTSTEGQDVNGVVTAASPEKLSTPDTATPTSQDEDDAPPTYSDSVNEYLLDPMQQFSAFPPVTLRKAQMEFRQSLHLATTLLSEQQRFGGMSAAASQMSGKVQNGEKA